MKNVKWLIPVAILIIVFFVPLFPINVVPEWSLRLVDENGQPVAHAGVDQAWKEYSLEFLDSAEHVDHSVISDANGIVTFPSRNIRVSAFQFVAAQIRRVMLVMNPHASYGPHAYILCRGSLNCSARYKPGEDLPTTVIVKR